ncbi:hypothetical protein [Variovorax sp.]|uniref:hypothetical protein n=1 Tax=Variovorax sp. TaxID=1871043 RepID=UPI002D26AD70|nr:hypothetical protein [Variovorax sp.]HYP83198.1 hypothetical protein [Variovorax sp.]
MPAAQYLFLSPAGQQPAPREAPDQGGAPGSHVRCLNSAGRWAVRGSPAAPLLAWRPDQAGAADAAAERAAEARGHPVVVVTRSDPAWEEGREIRLFTEASDAALLGHAPPSAAKARRLRNEADKLEAFCVIVRAASAAADHAAFTAVSRAAAKAMRTRFGGGSITSAFAWLAGPSGQQALDSVLAGEVELTGPLSLQEVVEAAELAQHSERLREEL